MLANAWHSAPVAAPSQGSVTIHKPFPTFVSGELSELREVMQRNKAIQNLV